MRIIVSLIFSCFVLAANAQQDTREVNTMTEKWDSLVLAMQLEEEKILNKQLPYFSLKTITRDTLTSVDLEGKPSIIMLWNLYCQPCLDQMEVLNTIRDKYKEKLNYISITKHDKHQVINFLAQDKLDFTHVIKAKKYLESDLDFSTLPKILITDKSNIVREVFGVKQLKECCLNAGIRSELNYYEDLIERTISIQ